MEIRTKNIVASQSRNRLFAQFFADSFALEKLLEAAMKRLVNRWTSSHILELLIAGRLLHILPIAAPIILICCSAGLHFAREMILWHHTSIKQVKIHCDVNINVKAIQAQSLQHPMQQNIFTHCQVVEQHLSSIPSGTTFGPASPHITKIKALPSSEST